jgi:hypothetical protein
MSPRSPRKNKAARPFEPHAVGRSDDANAFIPDPGDGPARTSDDLAESLAEDFLEAATTAQDADEERLDSTFPEEIGGPFVETTADDEMALDTDGNNPPDATREALPRAVAGIVAYPNVEDPAADSSAETDDEDEDEERDAADPRISPREADPARNVDELNEERGGRTN